MAVLDKGMKQRMVGALVLVALAVIFLLFTREDEMRQVRVEAPQAPAMPSLPEVKVDPVVVPEPQPLPEEPQQPPVVVNESSAPVATPSQPISPSPQTQAQPRQQAPVATPAPAPKAETRASATPAPAATASAPSKIDTNGLPVSWSIQLASLSNRAGAESLQKTLRSQGYNAYIRSAGGMNRVYVGPLIERAEAERLRDTINRQQNLKGFVVRFQPERG
ncbi:SPOR domain-containing protein [Pseudomonas putida]|uniref:SPOR domain-containing protein n=1 Tax=Pseudomonas putida TaxID=303 RepID=UPI0018E6817B|nr:SPOR domain-containing protein [Pseudomonas putida]MBI6941124.1 SPOR domain-containing protein [Pseudomonas putida]MBI6957485.1 SPOR domain-containing protein [Pseudomonas putida]